MLGKTRFFADIVHLSTVLCPRLWHDLTGQIGSLGSLWSDYGDRAGETAATSKAADPVPLRTLTTLTSEFRTVIKYCH